MGPVWTGSLNEVLVWAFDLDAIDGDALSIDELHRAARFRFDIHRERFRAARCALRYALGAVTGIAPGDLTFAYGSHGKPDLPGSGIHFNLSHSENRALLAVTRMAPVGVDIEFIKPERGRPEIARRFFAAQEIAELERLDSDAYTRAFFACWARKEAVLKALGTGISGGLGSFVVPIDGMPEPVKLTNPNCWVGNLAAAFPYVEAEGFSSAIALLSYRPLIRPVCDTVLRIPVRRTFQ